MLVATRATEFSSIYALSHHDGLETDEAIADVEKQMKQTTTMHIRFIEALSPKG